MSNIGESIKGTLSEKPSYAVTSLFGVNMPFDLITATYAIIVASGGIMGYARAQSIPSLAAGLTFGCLIATGSFLEGAYDHHYVTLGSSGLLGGMMLQRYMKSYKFMPSGLICLLSLGSFARQSYIIYRMYNDKVALNQPVINQ